MTAKIMRVGDIFSGSCNTHGIITGTITTGSSTTKANNIAIARVGDRGTCSCGHTFTITSGSNIVKVDGVGICRLGDTATVDIVGGNLIAQSTSSTIDAA